VKHKIVVKPIKYKVAVTVLFSSIEMIL